MATNRRNSKPGTCEVEGCMKPVEHNGLCSGHRSRWRKHGDSFDRGPLRYRARKGEPLRFLKLVVEGPPKEKCVFWPYRLNNMGYGLLTVNGQTVVASRLALALYQGLDGAPEGLECRHVVCGNGNMGCINPLHLEWGTHQQNQQDMTRHGRSQRGEKSSSAKLTEDDVRYIRSSGLGQSELAIKFDVTPSCISTIKSRRNWAWLK